MSGKSFYVQCFVSFKNNLKAQKKSKFRFGGSTLRRSSQRSFGRFPVNDEPAFTPPAKPRVLVTDNSLPSIAFGRYPYQLYQSHNPEEPSFISITPKSKVDKKINQRRLRPRKKLRQDTMKLVDVRRPEKLKQTAQMDVEFIKAVQQPNSKFVVEKFFFVPGKIAELSAPENLPAALLRSTKRKIQIAAKSQKLKLQKQIVDDDEIEAVTVKVESFGRSAADQPIPDYSAYFPHSSFTQPGKGEEATLILEPISKAISGNDGTSISAPISRAILRRDSAVKVLFRPQSVAITGANGIAHAQSELLLDFIDDE